MLDEGQQLAQEFRLGENSHDLLLLLSGVKNRGVLEVENREGHFYQQPDDFRVLNQEDIEHGFHEVDLEEHLERALLREKSPYDAFRITW
jgi:hypothetical protein